MGVGGCGVGVHEGEFHGVGVCRDGGADRWCQHLGMGVCGDGGSLGWGSVRMGVQRGDVSTRGMGVCGDGGPRLSVCGTGGCGMGVQRGGGPL